MSTMSCAYLFVPTWLMCGVLGLLAWAGQEQGLLFQVLQKHNMPILCSEVLARLQQSTHKGHQYIEQRTVD